MDDYKISEKSDNSNDALDETSDMSCDDEHDQFEEQGEISEGVAKICKEMEHFYNKNYKTYHVNSIRNIF